MKPEGKDRPMQSKPQLIEWRVCEDDRDWQLAKVQTSENPMPLVQPNRWTPPRTLSQVASSLLILLILVVLGGWWILHSAQQGLAKIETELQAAVAAEPWLVDQKMNTQQSRASNGWQAQMRREAEHLHSLAESGELVTNVQILDLSEDWALLQVHVQATGGTAAYHQTRLYQQTPQGWIRMAPTAEHWGKPLELESRYFIFHYFSQDAAAVEDVADKLDELYVALYAGYFPDQHDNEKIVIQIDPVQVPGEVTGHPPDHVPTMVIQADASLWNLNHLPEQPTSYRTFVVASPAATLAPVEMQLSELLAQSLALALLNNFADQATLRYDLPTHWLPLRDGLRLWLLWEQDLPLAGWRQPVVRWVFWESPTSIAPEASSFAKLARDLCAGHHLWMHSPSEIGIPVVCLPQEGTGESIVAWRYSYLSTLQTSLTLLLRPMRVPARNDVGQASQPPASSASVVALATLVEYAATAFGADRLPVLLAASPEHENWETLIPAVFGVSLEEFENGWHAFLAERYGLIK